MAAGRLAATPLGVKVHTSPIGLIPKPHCPGKFRLIVDLSAPRGFSVNDGIDPNLCSLEYATIDKAAAMVRRAGRGALMAKLDLSAAYRRIPVHFNDSLLLGLEWQGTVYIDKALPFGLRSAPKIFTAVADGLAWAMICRGVEDLIHYLDDFFFCSSATSDACKNALVICIPLCAEMGLPVQPDKVAGTSPVITFLGIEIDFVKQELRLPLNKLTRLQQTLREWGLRRCATKQQLQSLIGQLNHAAAVVRRGCTFLRHLIDTMEIPRKQ